MDSLLRAFLKELADFSIADWIGIILGLFPIIFGSVALGTWVQKRRFRRLMSKARSPEAVGIVRPVFLPEAYEGYLLELEKGISTLADLPSGKMFQVKGDIEKLVQELRKTHDTLLGAIDILNADDLQQFRDGFDAAHSKIERWVKSGVIEGEVRTRCHDASSMCYKISDQLEAEYPEASSTMYFLGQKMYVADNDAIVPLMLYVLSAVAYDLQNIKDALDDGALGLALRMKERARQRLETVHKQISQGIAAMAQLIKRATSEQPGAGQT